MSFQAKITDKLRDAGFNVRRYPGSGDTCFGRQAILKKNNIDLLLDVGGNVGNYGTEVRKHGYAGRMVSFEPVKANFEALSRRAAADAAWSTEYMAVGDADGTTEINVAGASGTHSSILTKDSAIKATVDFKVNAVETVNVHRLDGIWDRVAGSAKRVHLKLDVQGFEMHVLRGLGERLGLIRTVECELGLERLYAGQPMFDDIYGYLREQGFLLRQVWSHTVDANTAVMCDFDGIFERADA